MSMISEVACQRNVMGVHFHPSDAEIINYLKRFFKGHNFSSKCPIQFADIYGDQPPWEIFGDSKEKVRYFVTPLKKRKSDHARFCRIYAKGTWKGQTSENPIRKNNKERVLGFRRSFTFETKEMEQSKNWIMKEYSLADDFLKENNISKEDYAICRIKRKKIKEKKVKGDHHDVGEDDVAGIIEDMLHGRDDNYYIIHPTEDQVMEEKIDDWESIIDNACDEQVDEVHENTTTLHGEHGHFGGCNQQSNDQILLDTTCGAITMENQCITTLHGEYHDLGGCNEQNDQILQDTTCGATTYTMENQYTTLEEEAIYVEPLSVIDQQVHGHEEADIIGSNAYWEKMKGTMEDTIIDIPDDLWIVDYQPTL